MQILGLERKYKQILFRHICFYFLPTKVYIIVHFILHRNITSSTGNIKKRAGQGCIVHARRPEVNSWDCFIFLVTERGHKPAARRDLRIFSSSCGPVLPRHRTWWLCYPRQRCCHQVQRPQLRLRLPLCDCLGDLPGVRVPVQPSVWYKLYSILQSLIDFHPPCYVSK